ncbi:branched-chain amino acid ABC transporter permease [Pararhizobium sp.]|uniref:branched-chain amino acid ABC transporter permease n=1 Tax=Pararhizobium sp. TaxID=1977563 RepID=UPI003BA90789
MSVKSDLRGTAFVALLGIAVTVIAPQVLALFAIINMTTAIALALLGLSLGLVWGYGGILCFGQTAFFGIGAYVYALTAQNFGDTTIAVLAAIGAGALLAGLLGGFMFWERISDVYLGVITLTVTLILFSLLRRTSGPDYRIGKAMLGGFNGTSAPPLHLPWDAQSILTPTDVFYVAMAALIVAYLGCAWLTRSHFGRVCVAIRENETRAELLGYDSRYYKLGLFMIGGGIAGLAGVLIANGIGRVTPDLFNLSYAAQAIIWVIVGGRSTLIGPIIGAIAIFYLTSWLGTQSLLNSNMVLGIVLIAFVLVLPRGVIPALQQLVRDGHLSTWRTRLRVRQNALLTPTTEQ